MDRVRSSELLTPYSNQPNFPMGRVTVNERLRDAPLVASLQRRVPVVWIEETAAGVVDVFPSSDVGIVYVSEIAIAAGNEYKRRLVKLKKASNIKGLVLYENTPKTANTFSQTQTFVTMDLGLQIIPVSTLQEAANLIVTFARCGTASQESPISDHHLSPSQKMLQTVKCFPGVGPTKANKLLQHFRNIQAITNADVTNLTSILGHSTAQKVWEFVNNHAHV